MPLTLNFSQALTSTSTPNFTLQDPAKSSHFVIESSASGSQITILPTEPFAVKDLRLAFYGLWFTVDSSSSPTLDGTITLYISAPKAKPNDPISPSITMSGFIQDAVTANWIQYDGNQQSQPMTPNVPVTLASYGAD